MTTAAQRRRLAQYQRTRRNRRKAAGVCVSCREPRVTAEHCPRHAEVARQVQREAMRKRREAART